MHVSGIHAGLPVPGLAASLATTPDTVDRLVALVMRGDSSR